MIRPLFKTYQRELLAFANTQFGRDYLGIKTDSKIVKLTPDSWHIQVGEREYQATFYSRSPFLTKVSLALTGLDFVADVVDTARLIAQREFVIPHFLGLTTRPGLPVVLFDTVTKNPDANPETTTVDGYVERDGVDEVFGTIRAGAGTGSADSGTTAAFKVTCSTTNNQYATIRRNIYLFDTSSLTGSATISAAVMGLYVTNKITTLGSQSSNIYTSTPASDTALANTDYGNTGTTAQATAVALADITTSAYNDYTFDATGISGISKTGVSKYSVKIVADGGNSAPSWGSGQEAAVTTNFSDAGSNKPRLVITYTLPTAAFLAFF